MDENRMKMSNEIGIDIDEKLKYIIPVDEFDINFLQLNYSAYKARNNDNVVPLWSLQQNKIDNDHYEFEIVIGSSENTRQSQGCNPVNEITNVASTDNKNKMNITRKLNTTYEFFDFTTYMKLVNVFNESDSVIAVIDTDQESLIDNKPHVVKDEGPSIKTDHEETAKNKTGDIDQLVTLHVLSGEKIKVSMNNFHGISISGDGVQCRFCMVMVEDDNVEAHKMEIQHMKRIASAINNKHCIRKIGPIWNHCILCNEVIENIEFHLKCNTAHTKHLERALKLSKNANVCTTSVKNNVKSCLLSNPETTITVHQPTKNPKIEEKFLSQKLESHTKNRKMQSGQLDAQDNDVTNVQSNGTDKKHFAFDKRVLTSNTCKSIALYNVCNQKMKSKQVDVQIKGNPHNLDKTFIEQPKQTNYLMEVKSKVVQCKVCEVKLTNNVQNIQEHIDGRNHNMTYNFLLNYNKIKKGTGSFHCEICKQTVMETMEIDHISTSSHITMRRNYLSKTFNNKKDLTLVKRDSKTEELKNNADKLNTVKDLYYCDICEVGVPNYPHNIREHTLGLKHKANIEKNVSNNIISLKKKNTYYCKLCKTYFSKASLEKHLLSKITSLCKVNR